MATQVLNSDADLSGKTLVVSENNSTQTGLITFTRNPSPPFAVSAASAVVPNLDADKLDGLDGSAYLQDTEALAVTKAYVAGDYTSDVGTVTVDAGDLNGSTYVKLNRWMHWSVSISTASIAVATPQYLKIALPAGVQVDKRTEGTFVYSNNGGAQGTGLWVAIPGETFVRLYRDVASTVWAISANNNEIRASFLITTTN